MADDGGSRGADDSRVVRLLVRKNKQLEADNAKYRDKLRMLEDQVKKVPAENAVVLSADDAKMFDAFKSLNLKPDEITRQLEQGKKDSEQLTELRELEVDREAGAAVGFKPTVLSELRKTRGLALEMRDTVVEVNGKKETTKLPHVRSSNDEKAQWMPLRDYAEANLKDYLPALAVADEGSSGGKGSKPFEFPAHGGTKSKVPDEDKAGAFLERRAKVSSLENSPLARAAGLK